MYLEAAYDAWRFFDWRAEQEYLADRAFDAKVAELLGDIFEQEKFEDEQVQCLMDERVIALLLSNDPKQGDFLQGLLERLWEENCIKKAKIEVYGR